MQFSLKEFIKKGLFDAIGKQPEYWVRHNAGEWLVRGILDENDLAEIEEKIEASKKVPEVVPEEEEEVLAEEV